MPNDGIGIRVEDIVLVTEEGPVVLSCHIPRTAEEIERAMAEQGVPSVTSVPRFPWTPTAPRVAVSRLFEVALLRCYRAIGQRPCGRLVAVD
jgi:hypothetical protein